MNIIWRGSFIWLDSFQELSLEFNIDLKNINDYWCTSWSTKRNNVLWWSKSFHYNQLIIVICVLSPSYIGNLELVISFMWVMCIGRIKTLYNYTLSIICIKKKKKKSLRLWGWVIKLWKQDNTKKAYAIIAIRIQQMAVKATDSFSVHAWLHTNLSCPNNIQFKHCFPLYIPFKKICPPIQLAPPSNKTGIRN